MSYCWGVRVPCPGRRGAEGQVKRKGVTVRWGLQEAWSEGAGRGTGTGYAVGDGRDDVVSHLDGDHAFPHFYHLAEGFVTRDEVIRSRGRVSVLELPDLAVSAADADVQHLDFDICGPDHPGLRVVDQLDFLGLREYSDSLH